MTTILHPTNTFNVRASFNKWLKDALANITLPHGVTYTFIDTWPERTMPTPCISVIHADISREPDAMGRVVADGRGVGASGLADISVWVSRRNQNWQAELAILKSAVEAVFAGNTAIAVKNYTRTPSTPETVPYIDQVLGIDGANQIKYHVLNETSGTNANDLSAINSDGTYGAGVTLNGATGEDGQPAAGFDGNDYVNIYSSAFNSAYNGTQITAGLLAKVSAAGVWSDATFRRLLNLQADGNNRLLLQKTSTDNQLQWLYAAGGTSRSVSFIVGPSTDWFHTAVTISTTAGTFTMKAYVDGVQVGSTQTGTGTYAGSLSAADTVIGAADTSGLAGWNGYLQHVNLWDTAFTDAQIATLASVPTQSYGLRIANLDMGDTVADTGNPDIMRSRSLLRYEWTLRTNVS